MKYVAFGFLAVSLLLLAAGCADDDENNNPAPATETHLAITITPDTLFFVYGEDATMNVSAAVTDENGQPMAGQVVHLVLSDISLGTWTGGAQTLHDTTGSNGHVTEAYHAVLAGNNTIAATVGNVTEHATLISRYPYNGPQLTLNLVMMPATWNFAFMGDTATIDAGVYVSDESSLPVPGLNLHFTAQRGHLSSDYALTNADGLAHVWLTGAVGDFFVDDVSPETSIEVQVMIGAFADAELLLVRRQ